ncbi:MULTISPECIES: hypothetical protein [unclassified Chamaesiphon]|uniref:hypothetical protein n=1 Tax=unclassified Chamaesiphon TaxID=2620921 RepID=UPI00286CD8CA|nr:MULTISPECIES: hypothetical protein [unclassified Chamaesiphon]
MVQFTQLSLLSALPSGLTSDSGKRVAHKPTRRSAPRTVKPKVELRYLAFDDDYFWELIRKDYSSAWKYVGRMTRTL